jgi:hypothetical protein
MPAASINVVNSGSITVQAMIRVTTNSLKEFTERVSIASICSVARMFASCAPIPAADPAGHEQRSDQRPNLIEKRERLKNRDFCCRAKLDQGAARAQSHDDAERETGSYNECKRADADLIKLL